MMQKIKETADFIRRRAGSFKPRAGVVLGSGLGDFVNLLEGSITLPYGEIPNFLPPSVAGHAGKLGLGYLPAPDTGTERVPLVVLSGRQHYYEGHEMSDVTFATRVLCLLGIETLVVTNASGGVNPGFREGDVMMIVDHINFTGQNPLQGPNLSDFGPRFPDMTEAYDRGHQQVLRDSARRLGLELREGVYQWLLGPTYETPAEIRAARVLGADAVGMSTVPEVIVARHAGVKVAGVSCITNLGAGMTAQRLQHEDVVRVAGQAVKRIHTLLCDAIPRMK